jgi:hypothetical protein
MMMGRPVVDGVFLNGQGPYRFLIDTGAQANEVEATLAGKLGLAPAFQVEMTTVSGTIPVVGGRIAEVVLGSVKASNQEFLFTTLDDVHALSGDIHGVLGQEFLSRFDFLLDFANRRLVFRAPIPEGGRRVGVETIHGRPAIETSEGKLVLDSGTDAAILFRASSLGEGQVRTASGFTSVATVHRLLLRIAGREYHPANTAFIPRSSPGEDGELPASLFHAVFFSNSGRYVILDPVGKTLGRE